MRHQILAGIVLTLTAAASNSASISGQGTWETTLQGRLPLTPSGTDYQAYYDTDLNITWSVNGILSGGGCGSSGCYGASWAGTQEWLASLDASYYLGVTGWRLPKVTPLNGSTFDYSTTYTGSTDFGYNVGAPGTPYAGSTASEFAHLYYITFGNLAPCDPVLSIDDPQYCASVPNYWQSLNDGPFADSIVPPTTTDGYWIGTDYDGPSYPGGPPRPDAYAWAFDPSVGAQGGPNAKANQIFTAWAVVDGDIAMLVPIPAAAWLFGSAIGLLAWMNKRAVTKSAMSR